MKNLDCLRVINTLRNENLSDNTSIAMPMRNLISIVVAVAVGVWAYFWNSRKNKYFRNFKQLMEADLLKKAEQTPKNLEMLMLIEHERKIIRETSNTIR